MSGNDSRNMVDLPTCLAPVKTIAGLRLAMRVITGSI